MGDNGLVMAGRLTTEWKQFKDNTGYAGLQHAFKENIMKQITYARIGRLAVVAIALVVCAATAHAETRVACVGDSITAMGGPKKKNNYPSQLGEILGDQYQIGNFGSSGACALDEDKHSYLQSKQYQQALEFKPHVVVMMLGTNDSRQKFWPKHKDNFVDTYVKIIKSFQGLETKPAIWLCYPPKAYSGKFGLNDDNIKNEIIPKIDEVAKKVGAKVIDIHTLTSNREEMFSDGIHPTPEGSRYLAENVAAALLGKADKKKAADKPQEVDKAAK